MTPLLLRPDEAIAWAAGRKTRHTVVMIPQPVIRNVLDECRKGMQICHQCDDLSCGDNTALPPPRFQPGDRVRLLTTWAVHKYYDNLRPLELKMHPEADRPGNYPMRNVPIWSYFHSQSKPDWCGKLRPGHHLPFYMRHLMPETTVLDVRAERVQDITDGDAIAEGVDPREVAARGWIDARVGFRVLFNRIHGPGAWDRNDWVWVYKLEGPR